MREYPWWALVGPGLAAIIGLFLLTAVAVPAILVLAVGVLLVALTENTGILSAGRVLGGLGTGASVGATMAVLLRLDGKRGMASAAMTVPGILAVIVAPWVNERISEAISFRWTFLLAEPLLFVALAAGAVSGIVLFTSRRAAGPVPYGMASAPPYQPPFPPPYPSPYPPPPPPPYQQPYPPQGPPQ